MRFRMAAAAGVALLLCCNPTQPGSGPLGTQQQAVQVCGGPDTVPGIDVSNWQGQIDWDQVKGAGYAFAFAQINDGTTNDANWAFNWSEMKRVGLIRGPYQFYEPSMDSAWQAQVVVNAVGALGDGGKQGTFAAQGGDVALYLHGARYPYSSNRRPSGV